MARAWLEDAMSALNHPYLLAGGVLLMLVGFKLWRWAGRHDMKGLALDAAWQVAKARGDLKTHTYLGDKLNEVSGAETGAGKAKAAAGLAARHVAAQIASLAGIAGLLAGIAMIAAAFYLK